MGLIQQGVSTDASKPNRYNNHCRLLTVYLCMALSHLNGGTNNKITHDNTNC